jgi:hypothetical protein
VKVAAAAALIAALILGLAVGGVFAQNPPGIPSDVIQLKGDVDSALLPSPTPNRRDEPERVEMRVEEDHLDDKGGLRADEDHTDNSGRRSEEERTPEPEEADTDNSGRGSRNSGSGSGGDDS